MHLRILQGEWGIGASARSSATSPREGWVEPDARGVEKEMGEEVKLPLKITKYIRRERGHWIWEGSIKADGTARAFFGGKQVAVAKYLFNLIKRDARATVRTCSEPRCVNPKHRMANTEVLYS